MKTTTKVLLPTLLIASLALSSTAVMAQEYGSNIVDFTKKSAYTPIMNLMPEKSSEKTSDSEIREFLSKDVQVLGSKTSFCAEHRAQSGKLVGTIVSSKTGEVTLLVQTPQKLAAVKSTSKPIPAIGSTIQVAAKSCE